MKIEELKKELEGKFENYEEFIVDYYNNTDDINDIIWEIANNNVDIYTYDLLEWFKDNYEYIDEYVREFGIDEKNFDIIQIIRGAQYLYNERELYENKNIMLEYLAYYMIQQEGIEEITEEQAEEIAIINFYNIDYISELQDEINEIIKNEEE